MASDKQKWVERIAELEGQVCEALASEKVALRLSAQSVERTVQLWRYKGSRTS